MTRRLRVAAFSRILPTHGAGGMQAVAEDVVRGLAEHYDVEVFTTERPGQVEPEREERTGGLTIRYLHTGAAGRYSAAWFAVLDRRFEERHAARPFDVALSFSASARRLLTRWRGGGGGPPAAASFFGTHLDEFRAALQGARRAPTILGITTGALRAGHVIYRAVRDAPFMRAPDLLIVPTPADADTIGGTFRISARRFRVIPYGVAPELRSALVRVTSPCSTLVTVVARLERDKGIQILLPAVAQASTRVPHLRLRVVGDGRYRPELEALAASLGIKDRVEFMGALPYERIVDAYRGAAVVVNPRLRPTAYDHALVVGMATGLPVIASDYGDARFVAEADRDAVLVPPGNATALALAIERCLTDREWAAGLGMAGIARVRDMFCLERTIAAYAAVLEELVSARRSGEADR